MDVPPATKSLWFSLVLLSVTAFCHALIIDGYTTAANDRFANDAGFIAGAFDLSGVGISNDNRWATLIAPNVFLTAQHFPPSVGQSITFYQSNDPAGPGVIRTVASLRQRIGTSDLLLCTLNLPVPEGYNFYSYATESLNNIADWIGYPYRNREVYHLGKSPGSFPVSQKIAVGKNVVDGWAANQMITSPTANGAALLTEKDTGTGKVPYETFAQGGDSGAPLFWEDGNQTLRLIGISWFVTTDSETGAPINTGFSAVGSHSDDIDTFLSANGLPFQPLAPDSFTGSRISSSRIDLSWQDQSAIETEYTLERAESADGPWAPLISLAADVESYSDLSAPEGDVHYRLRAENESASDAVLASILTPYSLWAAGYDWGTSDQSPAGDANADGVANLVAYSMNIHPVDPLPSETLPYLETPAGSIDYFYRKNPDAPDLSFTLRHANGLVLADWQIIAIDGVTVTETDMGAVDSARLIRIRMPASTVESLGFFQLQINSSQLP